MMADREDGTRVIPDRRRRQGVHLTDLGFIPRISPESSFLIWGSPGDDDVIPFPYIRHSLFPRTLTRERKGILCQPILTTAMSGQFFVISKVTIG